MLAASVGEAIPLWDGLAPGSEGWDWEERKLRFPFAPPDFFFLLNVVHPTLTPVLPDPAAATGAAAVVCPGGAYAMLAIVHEGFDVAHWLADRGIAAFVLKYRVMETPESDDLMEVLAQGATPSGLAALLRRMDEFAEIPLADGMAALRHVRDRTKEWGLRTERVGAVGFSAGARLVLDLATHDDREVRPAFAGALYGPGCARAVPDDAPPLFVAAAADDLLFDGSVRTHAAWREAGRPVEAHLYGRGGHGFGMQRRGSPSDQWIDQFHAWMMSEGFIA
jgi:acetyl esterase/lipase